MNSRLKRALILTIPGIVMFCAIIVGMLYAAASTRTGLDYIAAHLGAALSDDQISVRIVGLNGVLTAAPTVEAVSAADKDGTFASASDIALRWRPWALWQGGLHVEAFSIARLKLDRLPAHKAAEDSSSIGIPPVDLALDTVSISEIAIGAPVFGYARRLALAGSAQLKIEQAQATLNLDVKAIDDASDTIRLTLKYAAQPAQFEMRARIEEPSGGLAGRTAGLSAGERLFLDISGDGPPQDWRGRLKIEAGENITAASSVAVSLKDETLAMTLEGVAHGTSLLPTPLRELVGPEPEFRIHAALHALDLVTLQQLTIRGDHVTLTAAGDYQVSADRLSAKIALDMPAIPDIIEGLPSGLLANGHATVDLVGPLDLPQIAIAFGADKLAYSAFNANSLSGTLTLEPMPQGRYSVTAHAALLGLETGAAIPKGLIGSTVSVNASGTVSRHLVGSELSATVTSGQVATEISAKFSSLTSVLGQVAMRMDAIGAAINSLGHKLQGKAQAEASYQVDLSAQSLSVTTSGALFDLVGNASAVAPLLGDRVSFSGAANLRKGDQIEIVGFEASAAAGKFSVDGLIDGAQKSLSLNLDIAVPALATLSTLSGTELGGTLSATAKLTGELGALVVEGQTHIDNFQLDSFAAGRWGSGFIVRQFGDAAEVALRIDGDVLGKSVAGSLEAVARAHEVQISSLNIAQGANDVTGVIALQFQPPQVTGEVRVALNDISDLPGAAQTGLAGAAKIQLSLKPTSASDIAIAVDSEGLHLGPAESATVKTGKLSARVQVKSLFSQPGISGFITGETIAAGNLKRGAARLELEGDANSIRWSLKASAADPFQVTVAANGAVKPMPAELGISVAALSGDVAGQPLRLNAPFQVTSRQSGWELAPVDVALAGGGFRFGGSLKDDVIDATLKIEKLPLRHATLIDRRARIEGSLDGALTVKGPLHKPTVEASFAASDIAPSLQDQNETLRFTVKLAASQSAEGAKARIEMAGPNATSASAWIETPFQFGVKPDARADDTNFPISGAFQARGRLDLIDSLIGLGEDRLDGVVVADAKLTGTRRKPIIEGDLQLSDGFYEGATTGTLLRELAAQVKFTGSTARLLTLTASDGATGAMSGTGTLDLADTENPAGGIELKFESFNALRHELAEITTSGTLKLAGTFLAPRIDGKLRVDKGEIRIPDTLPEGVVALEVEEVNGRAAGIEVRPNASEPAASDAFAAALGIEIELPGQTFVRGRGLNSEWKGNLKISGTSRNPRIAGKLQSVRGTFAFAGKSFVLKQGSVFFPGAQAVEPEIEAVAEAKLSALLARVEIEGSISKPTIGVSSEPALPQEDVLAHILFGKTTGQLSAIQAAQLAQTAATLSGTGGAGIVDRVRQALGVDVLNVESDEGDSRGASLKAGKYITEDVFLSVTQGTQPGSQKVGVEVQVLPNITVESNVSGEADSNIGVNWKWDY